MADTTANIAKGRAVELYNRVKSNDPANSAIIIIPVDAGATTDATFRDFDTVAAVLAGGFTERSTGGWNRKTLTDVELAALGTPDDTNDRYEWTVPDQTWTGVTAGAVTDLLVAYDNDTTAGNDANLIPIGIVDFPITPDGSDVLADFGAVLYRAS